MVDEKPSDLKPFGLDPARIEIAFKKKGDPALHRVLIGDKTPTGSELYAKLPDTPRVFLVSSYLDSTLNKNTFALRDKRVLQFDRASVQTVELTSGSTVLQFAKEGTEWRIAKPISARGDFGTIEGIVERISSLPMQGITAQETTDL